MSISHAHLESKFLFFIYTFIDVFFLFFFFFETELPENKQTRIFTIGRPKSISAGGRMNALLSEDGDVFTWGFSNNGALGAGSTSLRNVPAPVRGGWEEGQFWRLLLFFLKKNEKCK